MQQPGKLIIITGETAAGKDTVTGKLLDLHPAWKKITTTTTRQPRVGEVNHVDHDFITVEDFQKFKAEDKFLETNEYAGNFYGTPKSALNPLLQGQSLIWRIDISMAGGALELLNNSFENSVAEQIIANTKIIFIKTQDDETQKKRLEKRGMKEADINMRIERENKDLALGNFKNVVINYDGKLEQTVQKVEAIINS